MEKLRLASLEDSDAILAIYRSYIENSPITFEYDVPSNEEFKHRMAAILSKYPWFVYEVDSKVVGYSYANAFRERKAYDWSLEVSVYIAEKYQRRGIGRKLYLALFKVLKEQGYVNIIGGITLPNEASVKLHESLGFSKVGVFKNIGLKFKQWWDVGFWQLDLQTAHIPD